MEQIIQFFKTYSQEPILDCFQLPASGSARENFILKTESNTFVITHNENIRENESFFYFSEIFMQKSIPTPRILHISTDRKTYIQSFLGDTTLFQIIQKEGLSDRVKNLVKQVLIHLYALQCKTQNEIDFSKTFEYEEYNDLPITHDLYYFKNFLVDVLEIHYHKSSLLKEFKTLTKRIENLSPKGVMIRDFQSRNIMINDNDEVGFIDYQSAMKGVLTYDVVSFLFQAKAHFPEDFKNEMLDFYYKLWNDEEVENQLKASLDYIKLIRFMQVLGAYGFRGLIQRKAHFLASLEQGIVNLTSFAKTFDAMQDFPTLANLIQELTTQNTKTKIQKILSGKH